MMDLSPAGVLRAIPRDCHDHITVIGSLAAGYHFFGHQPDVQVRTKDVDCELRLLQDVIVPFEARFG